ncbi:hypothetical protein CBL_00578 [Carabus blaptoides fortunei]
MCSERRGRDGADVGYHGNHLLLIENQPDDESIKRDRTQVPLDLSKTDSTRSLLPLLCGEYKWADDTYFSWDEVMSSVTRHYWTSYHEHPINQGGGVKSISVFSGLPCWLAVAVTVGGNFASM